jgi:hypothetical protein
MMRPFASLIAMALLCGSAAAAYSASVTSVERSCLLSCRAAT